MCLRIDLKRHPNLQPLIAKDDIVVSKVLEHGRRGWTTPYQHKRVFFIFGEAKLRSKLKVRNNEYVDEGIHSCSDTSTAVSILSDCDNGNVLTAIIPKGAKYFIGKWGDVVSNKLIIYKSTKKCV